MPDDPRDDQYESLYRQMADERQGFPGDDRPGVATGRRLLPLSDRLFRHWHRVRDGILERVGFPERMNRLRREGQASPARMGRGVRARQLRRPCFEILKVEEGLRTFARIEGLSRRTTRWSGRRGMRSSGSESAVGPTVCTGVGSWSGC